MGAARKMGSYFASIIAAFLLLAGLAVAMATAPVLTAALSLCLPALCLMTTYQRAEFLTWLRLICGEPSDLSHRELSPYAEVRGAAGVEPEPDYVSPSDFEPELLGILVHALEELQERLPAARLGEDIAVLRSLPEFDPEYERHDAKPEMVVTIRAQADEKHDHPPLELLEQPVNFVHFSVDRPRFSNIRFFDGDIARIREGCGRIGEGVTGGIEFRDKTQA